MSLTYKLFGNKKKWLELKLRQAGMDLKADEFIKRTAVATAYLTFGLMIIFFLFFSSLDIFLKIKIIAIGFPIIFLFLFSYMLKLPDVKVLKIEREINKEIVFAGRYLVIEIESGITLFKAMENISANYPKVGKVFDDILAKVDMGTTLEDAMNEAIMNTPAKNMRKFLWQILNSIRTGSNLKHSLDTVINQIVQEQKIAVMEYGRKLNPLAMFYMMIAVIVPSIGITMFIVLSSFMGFQMRLPLLMTIALFLCFVQFMFLSMIKSSRPAVEL
ncbi:type II secretion system F family protein [Candidatus Woesearchaeota archaeon]|nr:type II secretion system F family protein [Candidatus Woesearchaeota archaeon]